MTHWVVVSFILDKCDSVQQGTGWAVVRKIANRWFQQFAGLKY